MFPKKYKKKNNVLQSKLDNLIFFTELKAYICEVTGWDIKQLNGFYDKFTTSSTYREKIINRLKECDPKLFDDYNLANVLESF